MVSQFPRRARLCNLGGACQVCLGSPGESPWSHLGSTGNSPRELPGIFGGITQNVDQAGSWPRKRWITWDPPGNPPRTSLRLVRDVRLAWSLTQVSWNPLGLIWTSLMDRGQCEFAGELWQ